MRAFAHERFSREVSLTPDAIRAYAASVGDDNPIHHDPEFAGRT